MKRLNFSLIGLGVLAASVALGETGTGIKLNTIGYLPEAVKRASVVTGAGEFAVVSAGDEREVLRGPIGAAIHNADTGEELRTIDFSKLTRPGEYRLKVSGLPDSPAFRVGADVYREPFFLVTRAMYLWRCGVAVDGEWKGRHFHHEACHLDDAWTDFVNGKHEKIPSTGGWHDAGDYNKYIVNAGVTVGAMLRAWEDFGPALQTVSLKIPESGGALPDFLAELKFETDWILTMQRDDGAVYTKVSTQKFGPFILPEKEHTPRYFAPAGTPATADFTAMLAQASRAFRPYLPDYADRCLAAAKKAHAYLLAHPGDQAPDQSKFKTGAYGTKDPDDRLWAAAELWETTGDAAVLAELEKRIHELGTNFDEDFDWGLVRNLGLVTYLRSARGGRDASLLAEVRGKLIAMSNTIAGKAEEHGYGRALPRYYWGCNGSVARQAVPLETAYRLTHDGRYRTATLDALNYLFGRNVDGRSYVTGLGEKPPLLPHDRRSGGDDVDHPWPGYLVGGPHPKANSWKDLESDYSLNEIAINWNGALIYALAAVVDGGKQ